MNIEGLRLPTLSEIKQWTAPDRLVLVWGMFRGDLFNSFLSALEHKYFPPGTPANDDFQIFLIQWTDLPHWVLSIPMRFKPEAKGLAAEHNVRIADGIPIQICHSKRPPFPLTGANVFTLEPLLPKNEIQISVAAIIDEIYSRKN